MITGTGDLPITGTDLNVSCITVRGTAVLHAIRLRPDVAVLTELTPGAGLSVGVVGRVLTSTSFTHHLHRPVGFPRVRPVPEILMSLLILRNVLRSDLILLLVRISNNHISAPFGQTGVSLAYCF